MDVKFKDLSGGLKTAIILAYIIGSFYALTFVIGFVQEVASW